MVLVRVLFWFLLILQSAQSFDVDPPFCGFSRRLLDENVTDTGVVFWGLIDGSDSCNPECEKDIEFCGKDGRCYPQSCENFYQFGNSNFTGIIGMMNATDIPPLDCEAVSQPISNIPVSTTYGCVGGMCVMSLADEQHNLLLFNKVCTAQLDNKRQFVCYELAEDTSFDAYANFTASSKGIECPYENRTEPNYIYRTSISRLTAEYYGTEGWTVNFGPDDVANSTFDESLAFATFSSRLQVTSTNETTTAPTSGKVAFSKVSLLTSLMVAFHAVAIWQ